MLIQTQITVIGAGLAGMTAACAFARLGLDVIVIDSVSTDTTSKKEADGRTCAIAAGSANIFAEIGVWDDMRRYAGEILDIRVTDNNSSLFLHYDHALIGNAAMGYIIENFHLRQALFAKAASLKNIKIIAPYSYKNITFNDDKCIITGANNDIIESDLLIGADGKNSNVRKLAGIRTHEWQYNQMGLVCSIAHENHHQYVAQERFLPTGPFAVLPMQGGYHSSLVWTEKTQLAKIYMQMDKTEIEEQISIRTGEYLGKITLASNMFSYPLALCKAKQYTGKNMALIGDAAHAMHPLAGQGFNVGIRDVAALMALLKKSTSCNKNNTKMPSPPQLATLLKEYQAARMQDSIALLAITDLLNRTFSNNIAPMVAMRRLGMALVNKSSPLKKFFMQHASGI